MLTRYHSYGIISLLILISIVVFFFGVKKKSAGVTSDIPNTQCAATEAGMNCLLASGSGDSNQQFNILGKELEICSKRPMTGFERDGYCKTGPQDAGNHSICAVMTTGFLAYTLAQGNDLITPNTNFPGLKAGDRWCLCASRRYEAYKTGIITEIITGASNQTALKDVPASVLGN